MEYRSSLWILALLLLAPSLTDAASAPKSRAYLSIYTDLNYIEEAGEFYGLQVVIVPYTGGTKILWRSGSGKIETPLLLEANKIGGAYKVTVPEDESDHGEWTLTMVGNVLHAVGPRGLKFDLRELPVR
jgi:hypothetical protein